MSHCNGIFEVITSWGVITSKVIAGYPLHQVYIARHRITLFLRIPQVSQRDIAISQIGPLTAFRNTKSPRVDAVSMQRSHFWMKSFQGFFAENRLIDLPITFRKRLHVTVFFHYRDTLDTGCNRPNVTMCHDSIYLSLASCVIVLFQNNSKFWVSFDR